MVQIVARYAISRGTLVVAMVTLLTVNQAVLAADGPARKVAKRARGRLPAYYSQVVNEEQRERIYAIQEEYQPRIDALEAERKALQKERDEKIAALLTPEQKKKLDEARAAAKSKQQAQPERQKPNKTGAVRGAAEGSAKGSKEARKTVSP